MSASKILTRTKWVNFNRGTRTLLKVALSDTTDQEIESTKNILAYENEIHPAGIRVILT